MDDDQSTGEESISYQSLPERRRELQLEVVEKYTKELQPQIRSINRTLEQGEPVDPEAIKELRAQLAAFDEFLSFELYAIGDLDATDLDTIEYPPIEDRL